MIPTSAPTEQIRSARVVGRREVADEVIELDLTAHGPLPLSDWEPGAHIDLRLGQDVIRQYSLVPSSTGEPGRWTVAVLIEKDGRGGSKLIAHDLHEGSVIKTSGPRNHFPFEAAEQYLFIAGGIGITPFIAMCRAAEAAGAQWRLVYLGRSRSTMAYLADLEAEFPGRVDVYAADDRRFDVASAIAGLEPGTHVYCCGPDRLMSAVEETMSTPDLLPFVHLEHFHPRAGGEDENEEFTVYAAASDVEFVVPYDESVLVAADFAGVVVPGDCLEGTCGSCETRVLAGKVDHRDSILSPLQRRESTSMMICVSRAAPGCPRLELDL